MNSPMPLIKSIRDSGPYMQYIFTHGGCWRFHQILKQAFPKAKPYYVYDADTSHVITKIGRKFYDITGVVDYGHRALPFDEKHYPRCTKYRERWYCTIASLVQYMTRNGRFTKPQRWTKL